MKKHKSGRSNPLLTVLRTDFRTFVAKVFETATGGETLSADRYLDLVCLEVERVHSGETRLLVVSMPARHAKTLVVTVGLSLWELAHNPAAKIIIVCYDDDLAQFIANKIRDVLSSDWFKAAFKTRIRDGRNRAMDFETTQGGRVFASSITGGVMGHGADLIIVDDPADVKDARAPHRLEAVNDTFDTVIRSRLNHPSTGRIVVVGHRLAANDLSGHVLREGDWRHLKLSLVAEQNQTYVLPGGVWHRRKGELLRAGEFSDPRLRALRKKSTVPDFDTYYQQSPPEATWRISKNHFATFGNLSPDISGIVLSIDTAHVPHVRNSFSVIQVWRATDDAFFLIDQWRDQVPVRRLEKQAKSMIRRLRPTVILVEAAGAGISLAANLDKPGRGINVEPVIPGPKGKLARFAEIAPLIKARKVFLPSRADWKHNFIEELTKFPNAPNDDQVDALSQYLSWQSENPLAPSPRSRDTGEVRSLAGRTPPTIGGYGLGAPRRNVFSRNR